MDDEYLLERGYKEYLPNPVLDNESIVKKFQKRFDDDFGKKYFIDVTKWSHDYVPVNRRDNLQKISLIRWSQTIMKVGTREEL